MKLTIKTKFDLNRLVYYVKDWDIFEAKITDIKILGFLNNANSSLNVDYIVDTGAKKSVTIAERELFGSVPDAQRFLIGSIKVHRLEE